MNSRPAPFLSALELFQSNRLPEAESALRRILKAQPSHSDSLLLLVIILLMQNRHADAEPYAARAVRLNPRNETALSNYALILMALGRHDEALGCLDRAFAINGSNILTIYNRGAALSELRRYREAINAFDAALKLDARFAMAHVGKGNALCELQIPAEALVAYDAALQLAPDLAAGWLGSGHALTDLARFDDALAAYEKALQLKPDLEGAYVGRGNALLQIKRLPEALAEYEKALSLRPNSAISRCSRGNVLYRMKRYDEGLADYEAALSLDGGLADAWLGAANAYYEKGRFEEAASRYDKALSLKPMLADAWLGRGNVFHEVMHYDEALADYDRALTIKPDLAAAWLGRGNVFYELRCYDEANSAYDKALELAPDLAEAWLGRGNLLRELGRFDKANAAFDTALLLNDNLAGAWVGRGNVAFDRKAYADACVAFTKVLELKPDSVGTEGLRIYSKMYICDWRNFDSEYAHLISSIRKGKPNSAPFALLSISSSPEEQVQCAKSWIAERCSPAAKPIWQGERYRHDKIRIAYVSSDFRNHPVSALMVGVFEQHDVARFETTAISLGPDDESELRRRLKRAFASFVDAGGMSDLDIARLVRDLEVDILVDLMGFTKDSRTSIFSWRPAPIQVSYLGYAGSMGATFIDYLIADSIVVPESHHGYYSEKIISLPNTFLPSDSKRTMSDRVMDRTEFGLPKSGVVFCCFNNSYKITPTVFEIWLNILKRVAGSILWLSKTSEAAATNLRAFAVSRGVDPDRLIFAERIQSSAEYLARYRLADLFLDTLPYNAHATASDAIWAGLPVLTCMGDTFASRVAASLLHAVRLPELITTTLEHYEQLALDLAEHPEKLTALRHKLEANRPAAPAFDTTLFTKHIESAFIQIQDRYQAGLSPDHLIIRD